MQTVSNKKIRVLIADNHKYFRQTLRLICEAADDLTVVGESENGDRAVDMARRLRPDVILMDVRMPVMNGIRATSHIVTESPVTRVVILTMAEVEDDLFMAIRAGARSYLLKEADAHMIIATIRSVHRGEVVLSPPMLVRLFDSIYTRSAGAPAS